MFNGTRKGCKAEAPCKCSFWTGLQRECRSSQAPGRQCVDDIMTGTVRFDNALKKRKKGAYFGKRLCIADGAASHLAEDLLGLWKGPQIRDFGGRRRHARHEKTDGTPKQKTLFMLVKMKMPIILEFEKF